MTRYQEIAQLLDANAITNIVDAYEKGRADQRKEDEELNYHYQTSHECYMQGRADILNAIKNDLHKLWIDETNKPYTNQGVIEGLYLGIQRCNWYLSDDKEQKE